MKRWIFATGPLVFLWLFMWVPTRLFTKMNNCFYYAVENRIINGGKIKVVRSTRGSWHHFYWQDKNGECWEYTNSAFDKPEGLSVPTWKTAIYWGKVRKYEKARYST